MYDETSLDEMGEQVAHLGRQIGAGEAAVRTDKIALGKLLIAAEPRVYAKASNLPRNEQSIQWKAWLIANGINLKLARKCMNIAAAPDPEQALADTKTKAREQEAARKARQQQEDEVERDLSPQAAQILAALIDTLNMKDAEEALEWALAAARRVMNKAA